MKHLADIVTRKHPLSEDLFQHCYLIAYQNGMHDDAGFFFGCSKINGSGSEVVLIDFTVLITMNYLTKFKTTKPMTQARNRNYLSDTLQPLTTKTNSTLSASFAYTFVRDQSMKLQEYQVLTELQSEKQ
jgi:hypothetical protein